MLEFAVSEDVKNAHLDRGARRALVGLFGEGWCTSEFASLPQKIRDSLLKGVGKRTTPLNVFALLFAAEHAMTKLNPVIDAWADMVREMILTGRRGIDETLCSKSEECFAHPDWLELMETDGVRFEDGERVEWIMASIRRGMNEKNAATVYQVLDYISICFPMSLSLFLCRPWFRLFYCDPTSQRAMRQCFRQHHIYGFKSSKFAWMFCGG